MKHRTFGKMPLQGETQVVMMVCTSGHVDHGKTRLVGLLTGCNTDRLKEEQERGLTIELGFAPCFLGEGIGIGIVDVPGHEKFIKNMVAGVSGIGMTILAIAADDGVMPQTVEHFQIMDLLGVRRGMVALTKIDLVDAETVELRKEEIREFLRGTFMEDAPICPVSSETFEGYPEFYNTLVEQVTRIAARRRGGVFRMPIERVFAREGFGTVMTGIPLAGSIRVGDRIEVVPGGLSGKIRGIQRFGRDAEEGGQGQCLALNIPDLGKTPPTRGQVVCAAEYVRPARILHLLVAAVPGLDAPIENADAVKFHTGTIEKPGRLYVLEKEKALVSGARGLATVVLSEPIAVAVRDRFILRRPSPPATIAGGEILAITHGNRRPRASRLVPNLRALRDLYEGVDPYDEEGADRRVEAFLQWDRPLGATLSDTEKSCLLPGDAARASLERLRDAGKVRLLNRRSDAPGAFFVLEKTYRTCVDGMKEWTKRMAAKGALDVADADLRREFDWPAPLKDAVLTELTNENLVARRGDRLVLRSAVAGMNESDRTLMERMLDVYERTGFESPRPEELPDLLKEPAERTEKMLRHLCSEGRLVRVAPNVVFHYNHYKRGQEIVVKTILEKGALDTVGFKNLMGASRKYAVAFLDHLDARRVTLRVRNDRRLTKDYAKNLLP
ncbi:selenocysteine-specific translation elongation factor [Candidatus Sumerlaeota bacterium]|nr:selenocysteine-specific translation elongation factor [Candidatus Sumerlaeota bacterium]